jgi:hypothetical protein
MSNGSTPNTPTLTKKLKKSKSSHSDSNSNNSFRVYLKRVSEGTHGGEDYRGSKGKILVVHTDWSFDKLIQRIGTKFDFIATEIYIEHGDEVCNILVYGFCFHISSELIMVSSMHQFTDSVAIASRRNR